MQMVRPGLRLILQGKSVSNGMGKAGGQRQTGEKLIKKNGELRR